MASEDFVVRNGLVVANSTTTHVTANAVGVTANSFSGNAVNLTTLNATELTTGTVPSARLSGAYNITSNNATYLNGQLASYYLSASNLNAGTLPSARLSGSYTIVASNSTLATKASTVASGGGDGAAITFTSTTNAGTPTYVWGGTTTSTGALYQPANFSVNYATSAGSASTATSASSATLATKASTVSQGGGTGAAMTFNWVGQTGQPSWLWGGNDGVNHYVWNPANFSVNYATSAGSATSATSASSATLATKASTLSQGGGNGTAMTFNYAGQSGQPTYLWGTNNGSNMYVWVPSNFNVNSAQYAVTASSASNADTVDGYHAASFALASHTHAASAITSGTIATARLGTGTASSDTFLSGDQTYKVAVKSATAIRTSGDGTGGIQSINPTVLANGQLVIYYTTTTGTAAP